LLSSAILASRGIAIKKRLFGFLLSIPTVFLFNIIRIVTTIFFIVYLSIPIAEFLHSFLFRIFLIILVIGFYYLWFKINFK
jgi:exosortase/archaeosortase family protein